MRSEYSSMKNTNAFAPFAFIRRSVGRDLGTAQLFQVRVFRLRIPASGMLVMPCGAPRSRKPAGPKFPARLRAADWRVLGTARSG
jgi:hypothetical protein